MLDTLASMLEKAGQALGVATDMVYTVLLQQAKVEFIWNIIILVSVLLLIIAGSVVTYKFGVKWHRDTGYTYEWCGVVSSVAGIITGITAFIFTLEGTLLIKECIQIIVNPPVWVLQFLTELIK